LEVKKMKKFGMILAMAVLLSMFGAVSADSEEVEYLHFKACIDGSDYMYIQDNSVWYVHRNYHFPGQGGCGNSPTWINGDAWFPTWNGKTSDKYTNLYPPQPSQDFEITLEPIKNRWSTSIVQYPNSDNGYTTIVFINDDPPAGASGYEFKLYYTALDEDNDGVTDEDDACPLTPLGSIINTDGCSIAQLCPADVTYKNHGKYVSCVSKTAEAFLTEGLISEVEKDATVSEAAKSSVGKKSKK
jgi:hypothetical protein